MTTLQRILSERRAIIVALALGVITNIIVYALVVHPLGVKSAGSTDRAEMAARGLKSAEYDLTAARGLVEGKKRAEQALATFYDEVLPSDQSAAVRMTYAPLAAIAKKTNVKMVERRHEVDQTLPKNSRVGRLQIHLAMQGDYENVRQFIYEVERAREFVIIDNFTLTQADPARPLTLTLELSAFYRLGRNGS